jgi:hypothetical protein
VIPFSWATHRIRRRQIVPAARLERVDPPYVDPTAAQITNGDVQADAGDHLSPERVAFANRLLTRAGLNP